VGKKIGEVKLAVSGAGAAAIACLDVMVGLGVRRENIFVCDSKGVIHSERADVLAGKVDESKQRYCQNTSARTLADVVKGADVFLGCSAAGVMSADMVSSMGTRPIILALANPEPEIRPELAKAARPDCIIATGRSDYPNQVNNVLCFPYIFRGALDCGATKITEAMKLACVREIAALAKAEASDEVAAAYQGKELKFGPDYLIPTPFDVRLILRIAPAVAKAAAESGVATRPISRPGRLPPEPGPLCLPDRHVHAPGVCRRQGQAGACGVCRRRRRAGAACPARGAGRRHGATPILVGRPDVVKKRIERAGLKLQVGRDFELCDPEDDPRFREYWELYRRLMAREGVTPDLAKATVRRSNTLIASLMLRRGEADAMLCGMVGRYDTHLGHVQNVIGCKPGVPPWPR
jgi:malate dehydrogenase (oxaloacetate-decarboxylating)(NADP+)